MDAVSARRDTDKKRARHCIEDFLEMEFDATAIDEAYRCYMDGWSVDDFRIQFSARLDFKASVGGN